MYQNTKLQWKCISINIRKIYQTYCLYYCTMALSVTMNSHIWFDDDTKNNERKRGQDNGLDKV